MLPLVTLLRPYNWIKNLFLFVPLFFAKEFFNTEKIVPTTWAFIAFCLTASAVYIINDIADKDQDSKHSLKKYRPIASGKISSVTAWIAATVLMIAVAAIVYVKIPEIFLLLLTYFVLNILYSLWLKHEAVVDILLVATFYSLRIMIGGVAADVPVSHWLILCTIFISLFLIVGKRMAEYGQENKRRVLAAYTPTFLQALLIISATLSIISYSLYAVLVLDTNLAAFSVFFVLLGVMRYTSLILTSQKAEYPEKALVGDGVIVVSGLLWLGMMYFIFY